MEIKPVAYYRGQLGSKFGIPRQSGVVDGLRGEIVFEPAYRSPDGVRGLEGFSRIWLIWGFSASMSSRGIEDAERISSGPLTVRPPRLGGNERVGVFASRSPFRPNSLGLSCVTLESITEGPVLHVRGADLMDGTPIYDIKPYVPYADAFPDARPGFAPAAPAPVLEVVEGPEWHSPFSPEDTATLKDLLALDPRPAFHDDPSRVYGLPFAGYDIRFRVEEGRLVLLQAVDSGIDLAFFRGNH